MVRINSADTPWFADDVRVCRSPNVAAVMLPKAKRAEDLAVIEHKPLLPLIETAAGFDALRRIAGAAHVERLVFGAIDFQLDLGIAGDGDELLLFRSQIVLASRLAGLAPPVDGVSIAIDDAAQSSKQLSTSCDITSRICLRVRRVLELSTATVRNLVDIK